jgi:hypothetical protein
MGLYKPTGYDQSDRPVYKLDSSTTSAYMYWIPAGQNPAIWMIVSSESHQVPYIITYIVRCVISNHNASHSLQHLCIYLLLFYLFLQLLYPSVRFCVSQATSTKTSSFRAQFNNDVQKPDLAKTLTTRYSFENPNWKPDVFTIQSPLHGFDVSECNGNFGSGKCKAGWHTRDYGGSNFECIQDTSSTRPAGDGCVFNKDCQR